MSFFEQRKRLNMMYLSVVRNHIYAVILYGVPREFKIETHNNKN